MKAKGDYAISVYYDIFWKNLIATVSKRIEYNGEPRFVMGIDVPVIKY